MKVHKLKIFKKCKRPFYYPQIEGLIKRIKDEKIQHKKNSPSNTQ